MSHASVVLLSSQGLFLGILLAFEWLPGLGSCGGIRRHNRRHGRRIIYSHHLKEVTDENK
jgi:hypothetical protein